MTSTGLLLNVLFFTLYCCFETLKLVIPATLFIQILLNKLLCINQKLFLFLFFRSRDVLYGINIMLLVAFYESLSFLGPKSYRCFLTIDILHRRKKILIECNAKRRYLKKIY
jgi:hypothetical protein